MNHDVFTPLRKNITTNKNKGKMAEVIDNGHVQHTSNAKLNAALTTGIIGTTLAGLLTLNGGNGGLLSGLLGGGCGCNNNCGSNQGQCGCSTAQNKNGMYVMDEQELYLERKSAENVLASTKQFYEGQIEFNKTLTNSFFDAYKRDVDNAFSLYKYNRDTKDELTAKIEAVDKKVDVMAAIRPYQDALINAKIDNNALVADYNLARRTCRMIQGEIVLPNTPTVTGFGSYSCCCPAATTTTTT